MKKIVIVSVAILGLSTSAALAAKHHHAKKPAPAASTAMSAPAMPWYTASSADKQLYAKNKHDSGVK